MSLIYVQFRFSLVQQQLLKHKLHEKTTEDGRPVIIAVDATAVTVARLQPDDVTGGALDERAL